MSGLLDSAGKPIAVITRDDEWLNNPDKWRENVSCPVSLKWFNTELLKLGGAEPNGKAHYRAVWGQDLEASQVRDRYNDRFVPRYVFRVIRGYQVYVHPITKLSMASHQERVTGIPRIYVEAFIPAAVACRSGTQAGIDGDGERYSAWWPSEGDYMTMGEICEHDEYGTCCQAATDRGQNCHGYFRAPDDRDMDRMRQMWQQWQQMKSVGPNDAPDVSIANQALFAAIEQDRARREAVFAEVSHNTKSFFNTHSPQLSADPAVKANGKYHFLKGINGNNSRARSRNSGQR